MPLDAVRQPDRESFPPWKVEQVYQVQEGVCANCSSSLTHGFQRDHRNGDRTDNSIGNLQLLCTKCHYKKTMADKYNLHKDNERKILGQTLNAVDLIIQGKVSGAAGERLNDLLQLALKISRRLNEQDDVPEQPPAAIALAKSLDEAQSKLTFYVDGFRDGMKQSPNVKPNDRVA